MSKGTRPDAGGVRRDWVCLAVIGAPKGLGGAVRLTCFAEEPSELAAYNPLHAGPGGPAVRLTVLGVPRGGHVVAAIDGVSDRNAAAALNGTRLFVPRSRMPATAENEFYHHDLIGLEAFHADGRPLGRVRAVHDWGAGDTMEIAGCGGEADFLVPFTLPNVPVVDLALGRVVIDPPAGTLAGDRDP